MRNLSIVSLANIESEHYFRRLTPIPMPRDQHATLRNSAGSHRISNRLVKDKIAETVKTIRNSYDVKKKKGRSKPGPLSTLFPS